MTIGKRIQAARKKAGLTQAQLAKECGIATITIQQYERDKREPKLDTVVKIAEILSIQPWALFGGELEGDDMIAFELSDEQLELLKTFGMKSDETYFFTPGSPEADAIIEAILGLTSEKKSIHKMLMAFQKLNHAGQQIAIERVEELTEIPKYQKKPPQD